MSDFEDQAMTKLANHLARTYVALAHIAANLPIPVTLPTGDVSNIEAIPAVRRMMELADDQPMPEEQQAELYAICSFWLGALDLYGMLAMVEFHSSRAHSVAANLLMAENHMLDLTEWIIEQD
ncbi:hypothetical protein ABZ369_22460 [Streptomyces sp. NPDC005918]|uniref:hypothetical protein n=1 Tax=Streptomyces sp. NPDC005918 TaxID=3155454 RepID=UPI0033C08FB2